MIRDRLVLWSPVAMGAGVLAYFAARFEPPAWAGLALVAAGALGVAAARPGPAEGSVRAGVRFALALLAAAGLGLAAAQWAAARAPPLETLPRRATIVTGTVRMVEHLPRGRRITLGRVRLEPGGVLRRRVRVRLRDTDPARIEEGDRIAVRALIRTPSAPFVPGGWDLQRGAFFAGFAGYGFALGPARVLAVRAPGAVAGAIERLRETILVRFRAALPGAPGAIAATLFTGEQTAIPEADREAFRASGLAHLLAVAGLHIGIVMGLVFGAARMALAAWEWGALRLAGKPIAALAALAAGGFYMVLTGMHVPIERSFAMACLVTTGVLAGRRAVSLRGLALAGATLVLLAPDEVPGVSFQMSFSAVLALIAGYEALRPWLRALRGDGSRWRRGAGHLVALALTSLLAGGASAPFAAYHFGRVQLWFVPANMVAVPLTALWVMPAGLIALALMPLHLEALALVPMGWGIRAILAVGRATSALPGAVTLVAALPGWSLAALALGMAWLGLERGRGRWFGLVGIVAGLAAPALTRPADVLVAGNGAMVALRSPAGVFVLRGRGGSRFATAQWATYFGARAVIRLGLDDVAAGGAIRCGANWCVLRGARGRVLVTAGAVPDWVGCVAAVVVAPVALGARAKVALGARAKVALGARGGFARGARGAVARGTPVPTGCAAPLRIDRRWLRRQGVTALWLNGDAVRVATERSMRGRRPWVARQSRRWKRRSFGLPFAAAGP